MLEKTCCFIGHRDAPETEELQEKIREAVERLITEENVIYFLFGSRSSFDSLCHDIVSELQKKYPKIQRIAYTCRHECATLKEDKANKERIWSSILKYPVHIRDYDAEYEHKTKYCSGRASYVERNQSMINDSDFCIFYFNENHLPPRRKLTRSHLSDYQPKSGTFLAYKFAVQKKKEIINLYDCVKND